MEAPHQSTYPCSVGRIFWVSDTNGKVASRLGKHTEEPAEPLPSVLFLTRLKASSFFFCTRARTHTHIQADKHVARTLVSPSLFQCSVKRVILSYFSYLREEFPALVMIRHKSSLIKWGESSPKLTKEEILMECTFCKKPAWFRWKATVCGANCP